MASRLTRLPSELLVQITEQDIAAGVPGSWGRSPILYALARQFSGCRALVDHRSIQLEYEIAWGHFQVATYRVLEEKRFRAWLRNFDTGKPVEPTNFQAQMR